MITRIILLSTLTLALGACSKVGSESWCEDLKDKPKGEWTADEAGQYTKYCVLGMDPDKWCEKMADKPKDQLSVEDATEYAKRCIGTD